MSSPLLFRTLTRLTYNTVHTVLDDIYLDRRIWIEGRLNQIQRHNTYKTQESQGTRQEDKQIWLLLNQVRQALFTWT